MHTSGSRYRFRWGAVWVCGLWALVAVPSVAVAQSSPTALDQAVESFWAADSPDALEEASSALAEAASDIESVWSRLRAGRSYQRSVPTGRQVVTRSNTDGTEHDYVVMVPEDYDPSVRYPVRMYLHGGVSRPKRENGQFWRSEDRITREDAIVVTPSGWAESLWWEGSQIENFAGILNDLKRIYNVDENRVFLLGVSDGATGVFYHAFKATTPWAAFLLFNGHPVVLANPASDVDGDMHVTNLRNKPLFVINGGRDRLYPTSSVLPFLRLFREAGVAIDFRPQEEAGHDMSWWDAEVGAMDEFMDMYTRRPLPPRLSWETEQADRYNRAHWLVITELGAVEGEPALDPYNAINDPTRGISLGINTLGELQDGSGIKMFEVGADSIASNAGMRDNDVIIEIDGRDRPSIEDLKQALMEFTPGQRIPMGVQRDGDRVELVFVYPVDAVPQQRLAFPLTQPSGRVEIDQQRNLVTVRTRGVRRFTLLLSPEQFDFTQPVTVVTNGVTVFEEMVEPEIETLLRWVAIDQDRTAMYGAELEIEVRAEP